MCSKLLIIFDDFLEKMKKQQSVTGILFKEDKVLLLKRKSSDLTYQGYCLVGGKVDEGESLLEALIREVQEEIGLNVLTHQFYETHENDQFIIHFYKIEVNDEAIRLNLEEFDGYAYYDLNDLPKATLPITKKVLLGFISPPTPPL